MATDYIDGYWWSNDGLRLHYRDYNAGKDKSDARPPIICLPGLTRNSRDFETIGENFGEDWRVIALDFRGRGQSAYAKDAMTYVPFAYVQDLESLCAELEINHYIALVPRLAGL